MNSLQLIYIYYISLAFDAKGDDGGGVRQYVVFFVSVASAVAVILSGYTNKFVKSSHRFGLILLAHLFACFIFSLFNGIDFGRVSRVSINFVMFFFGFLVTVKAIFDVGFNKLLDILYVATIIACGFTLLDSYNSGLSVSDLRYSLVSSAVFLALPVSWFTLFGKRNKFWSRFLFILFAYFVILISATRNLLAAFVIISFVAFFVEKLKNNSPGNSLLWALIVSICGSFLLFGVMYILNRDSIEVMYDRVFSFNEHGFDITSATRLAEVNYQVKAVTENFWNLIFGVGLGAEYGFSGDYANFLYSVFGAEGIDISWWAPGHNFWIYSVFSQGLIFGLFYPVLFIGAIVFTFYNMIYPSLKDNNSWENQCIRFGFLCMMSILCASIGGNPLGPRNLSAYSGVAFAFCYVGIIVLQDLKRK